MRSTRASARRAARACTGRSARRSRRTGGDGEHCARARLPLRPLRRRRRASARPSATRARRPGEPRRMLAHDRAAVHFAAALELLAEHGRAGRRRAALRRDDRPRRMPAARGRRRAPRDAAGCRAPGRAARRRRSRSRGRRWPTAAGSSASSAGSTRSAWRCCARHSAPQTGGDSITRARLLAQLAMETSYDGDWSDARARSATRPSRWRGGWGTPRRSSPSSTSARCALGRARARAALARRRRGGAAARPAGGSVAGVPHQPPGRPHSARGRRHRRSRTAGSRRCTTMPSTCGQPTFAWYERVARAKRALMRGTRAGVRAAGRTRPSRSGIAAGQPDARAVVRRPAVRVRARAGAPGRGRLRRHARDLREQFPTLRTLLEAQLRLPAGRARRARGRSAATLARLMAKGLDDVPMDFGWLATVAARRLRVLAGRRRRARRDGRRRARAVGRALRRHRPDVAGLGEPATSACSPSTRGRPLEAHAHFARATAMHERCGARAFQAHVCVAWAELRARRRSTATTRPIRAGARPPRRCDSARELRAARRRARGAARAGASSARRRALTRAAVARVSLRALAAPPGRRA